MAKITIATAAVLIALGLLGYLGDSGTKSTASETVEEKPKRSMTALIPAFVGIPLLLCGVLALNESRRMHAMHGAVLIGLLAFLAGAGRGSMVLVKMMGGAEVNHRSLIFVWLMAVISGIYVWLCVNSFIQARKRRQAAEK